MKTKNKIPDYVHFLKQVRTSHGMTLWKAGKKIGVSRKVLWFWESGRKQPKIQMFERWLGAYGLKITIDFKDEIHTKTSRKVSKRI